VRAHGAVRCIFGVLCVANHEWFAALEPSDVQLGTFQPRDQRRIFFGNRGSRPALYGKRRVRAAGANRRPVYHHCARGLNMLRGFFVIFVLCMIAMVAVLGFRGQKSTQPPTEVFPDMVRQPKVRAQAPLNFFADGRGPRLPVTGTVPVGYEMPKSKTGDMPPGMTGDVPEEAHTWIAFSAGTDYLNTGKMGDQWGTG